MRFIRTVENLFGLPLGFTRVEYLQSSGTQYIDTGINAKSTLKTDIHFEVVDKTQGGHIFGGRKVTSGGRGYGVYLPTSGGIGFDYETRLTSNVSTTNGYRYRVVKDGASNTLYVNGVQSYTGNNTAATFDLNVNMALFYMKDSNTSFNASVKCKVFYFKIWDGNTLIRDFVPCLDNNNVPCMYDKVNGETYYNLGTGSFAYGRQIIPVEYLESTGTQYIDTGWSPSSNDLRCKFKVKSMGSPHTTAICGAEKTGIVPSWVFIMYGQNANQNKTFPLTGDWNNNLNGFTFTSGTVLDIDWTANSTSTTITDKVSNTTYTQDMGSTINYSNNNVTLKLFQNSDNQRSSIQMYYYQIWDNETLVRDYIPCKDENNVGYMFDTLTGTVYLNSGTGAFSVGENKYTSKLRLIKDAKELPDGYKRVEYLQSDGNQYIDTEYTINTATDEVLFNFQMISTTKYQWIMGEHDNGARFGVGVGDGTNLRNVTYGANTYKVNDTEMYNSIHYFVANSNGAYLNGTQVHGFETFSSSSTIYLFKLNLSGANGAAGKIWRYVQKRNGVLIRDMIPCLDPNNTPCMFDLVEGKPYYNQGTGNFNYGHTITPVEYLESSGTQYIDTGYIPSNTTGQYAKMQYTTVNNGVTFGGMVSGNGVVGPYYATSSANVGWWILWGTNEPRVIAPTPKITDTYEMYLNFNNDRIARVDNTLITSGLESISGNYPSLTLFRRNYSSGYAYLSGKIFSYKITEGTEVVRSLIPVRDENNVGYMFDEVTGQLFSNAGSGSFGIGNDLPTQKVRFIQDVLPREYRPLKYLESNGNQYIDTGIHPTDTYGYRIKNTYTVNGGEQCAIGCMDSNNRFVGVYTSGSANAISGGWGSFVGFLPNYTWTTGTILDVKCNYKNNRKIIIDETEMKDITDIHISGTISNTLCLFGRNSGGITKMKGKVYGTEITNGTDVVLDLYPVLRKSDNKPGMYDRITKQFFTNQGTGEFNYG